MFVDINEFKNTCCCGRIHDIFVKEILIEAGAIMKLPDLIEKYYPGSMDYSSILCDSNTYEAAGRIVSALLPNAKCLVLDSENLHADEKAVAKARSLISTDTNLLIAVGSGTIHDITRYLAHELGHPFVSVPTAASVDGFVSTVAAMTWNGFKISFPSSSPVLVVADSTIFSQAPYRLTASGISDLIGKYTAIADWKIAHVVTGEYICERICQMEEEAVETVCSHLDGIRSGNNEAMESLMYALILSGLAMQMVGNSRPASGAEHHLSHLWEMALINPHTDAYHGEKVSVGLVNCISYYHLIRDMIENDTIRLVSYQGIETSLLTSYLPKAVYEDILKENTPDTLASVDMNRLENSMIKIAEIIETLPTAETIFELLQKAGCTATMEDISLSPDILSLSLKLAPYIRNRLTLLKLSKLFIF